MRARAIMSGMKLCSNGGLYPDYTQCPPGGPYPPGPESYPFESTPIPQTPPDTSADDDSYGGGGGGGVSLSPGAVAGIIIVIGFLFMIACLFALKFGARWAAHARRRNGGRSLFWVATNLGPRAPAPAPARASQQFRPGLPHTIASLLPVSQFKDTDPAKLECAVCLASFRGAQHVRVLPPCKHTFHLRCIDQWFQAHSNCPLCREEMTLEALQSPSPVTTAVADDSCKPIGRQPPCLEEQARENHRLEPPSPPPFILGRRRSLSTGSLRVHFSLDAPHHHKPPESTQTIILFTKSFSLREP